MCWNIFFGILIWRVIRGLFAFASHILTLMPIIIIHLYRRSNRQALLAHRQRDSTIDTRLGWFLMALLIFMTFSVADPIIKSIIFFIYMSICITLFLGYFRPLDLLYTGQYTLTTSQAVKVFTFRTTRHQEWNKQKANHLIYQLIQVCPELILMIEADAAAIYWRLIDPTQGNKESIIRGVMHSIYPDIDISMSILSDWPEHPNQQRQTVFFKQAEPYPLPIQDLNRNIDLDPLMLLSQIGNELKLGERISVILALGDLALIAKREGKYRISKNETPWIMLFLGQGSINHLKQLLRQENRVARTDDFNMKLIDTKLNMKMYYAALWVQVQSIETHRSSYLAGLIESYIKSVSYKPYNQFHFQSKLNGVLSSIIPDIFNFYRAWRTGKGSVIPPTLVLTAEEIASLWHLPHSGFIASRIQRIPKWLPISEMMAIQTKGNVLGKAHYHRTWVDARIELDMRRLHTNIVGQTGMGKSTFLFHQITQDIQNGHGVALIDPHGALVSYLLHSGVLIGRESDVVLIDLNDSQYPAPLNPFALRRTASGVLRIIAIIETLFEGTEQAVQTASFLRASLMLLSHQKDVTMKDIAYLFLDENYRADLLATTQDQDIHLYLNKHYHQARKSAQSNIANPILNRVRPFYSNPHLYPMICHPDSLDFEQLMSQNKIILISLNTDNERVPPQERHLLGTLLMSLLQQNGMRGQRQDPYFIYVDEVQHFITTSLNIIFAEARKNGLALTTANQYLGQLKGQTREAMLGNAGTNVVFRVGPDDVSTLSARTKPEFTEHDLLNLDAHTAVVKTQFHKATQAAFTLRTQALPPLPNNASDIANRIRSLSRAQYTAKSRQDVLQWLENRYQSSSKNVNLF